MPQTPEGLTYPDSSGHTRLWEHFQQLAEDVDDLVGPAFAVQVNEVTMTASSGWGISDVTSVRYGRVVQLHLTVTNNTGGSLSGNFADQACATLDDPNDWPVVNSGALNTASLQYNGRLSTAGNVVLAGSTDTIANGASLSFAVTYIAAGP